MISISGIRGVVGDGLNPEIITRYAAAFGNYCKGGKVVIGRDARPTGDMVRSAVIAGLVATGCDVVDAGIVPTPTIAILVEDLDAAGGICITASHNPVEWNALKFFHSDGLFLDQQQSEKHLRLAEDGPIYVDHSGMGSLKVSGDLSELHIRRILALDLLDVPALRKRNFRVALDCVNGAGREFVPHLLQELGCEVVKLGCEASSQFSRAPEPVPENLGQLCDTMKNDRFDIGFAVDPDADRLAIVDAKGLPLGEEQTLAMVSRFILRHNKGPVVANVSSSLILDDVCAEAGVELIRTRVGEINVSVKMRDTNAVIGGEGNGGVILPELHLGRDAPVGIALILQYLLETGSRIRNLRNDLPEYVMIKDKVELGDLDSNLVIEKVRQEFADYQLDETDGLKVIIKDDSGPSWVQIRASNTEPILRVFAESGSEEHSRGLIEKVRGLI
jgi:phosphomannomutase